jgi:hypothetical protein
MADPKTYPMVALQTLPARGKRKALKRGEAFEALTQERLDLLQAGRAQDAGAKGGSAAGEAKAK